MSTTGLPIINSATGRVPAVPATWIVPPKVTAYAARTIGTTTAALSDTSKPVIGPVLITASESNADVVHIVSSAAENGSNVGAILNPGCTIPWWCTDLSEIYAYADGADNLISAVAPAFDPAEQG